MIRKTSLFLCAAAAAVLCTAPSAPAAAPGFTPSAWDIVFPYVPLGQSSLPQVLYVQNTGTADTSFAKLEMVGLHADDFTLLNDQCSTRTLIPKEVCATGLVFTPKAFGTRVGHLRFDMAGSCSHWLTLAGGGIEATARTAATARAEDATPAATGGCGGAQSVAITQKPEDTPASDDSQEVAGVVQVGSTDCRSRRRVRIHFRLRKSLTLVKGKVKLADRSFAIHRGRKGRYYSDLSFVGLRRARYTVRIVGVKSNGKRLRKVRHFVTCVSGRRA